MFFECRNVYGGAKMMVDHKYGVLSRILRQDEETWQSGHRPWLTSRLLVDGWMVWEKISIMMSRGRQRMGDRTDLYLARRRRNISL